MHVGTSVPSKDVVPFLRNLADRGDTKKAGVLGRIFSDGADGVHQNEDEARRYTLAAALGGAVSSGCAGCMFATKRFDQKHVPDMLTFAGCHVRPVLRC